MICQGQGWEGCICQKMCSNISLISGGCGGDTGGYGVDDSMHSKKAKRQKVPKRGPGVAELEKILREQEQISDLDKIKNDRLFLIPPVSASHQPQSPTVPPPSSSLPKYFKLAPDPNKHRSPSISNATFYGKGSSTAAASVGEGGGDDSKSLGYFGGSGIFMSENAMLPAVSDPNYERSADVEGAPRSNSSLPFSMHLPNVPNKLFPSPSIIPSTQCSPPSTMRLFPQSAESTSSAPSPGGLCHGIEPPSNQTSYHHYPSPWPEEEKESSNHSSFKRSRPFSMEIPQIPSFRCSIPSFSPQMNIPDSSFLCSSTRSMINLEPSAAVDPRDGKVDNYLLPIPKFRKCNPNFGAANENCLVFGRPPIPPSPTHAPRQERLTVQTFSPQESTDSSQKMITGQCGSLQKKPFYSFLLPLEQLGKVDQNHEKIETREDGIDLNLRL